MGTTKKIAIYPGTFDPITNGHLDIIARAADLFDEVIVAVAKNSQKTPIFSESERLVLVRESLAESFPGNDHIKADSFQGLLVTYAQRQKANVMVRGLRALSDFEFEFQLALMNRKLASEITTVFLMPHEQYTYLNSTIIRELARYEQNVESFVPRCVAKALADKYGKKSLTV